MRGLLAFVLLIWVAQAEAWTVSGAGGLGSLKIGYLNEILAAMAEGEGASYEPMGLAGFAQATLRPWPFLGASLTYLGTQGTFVSREHRSVFASVWEMVAQLGWPFSLFGMRWEAHAGAGILWAWVSGLLKGSGLGLSGTFILEGYLWQGAGFALGVLGGYRFGGVGSLWTGREELRPRTGLALDVSGPFVGLRLSWGG